MILDVITKSIASIADGWFPSWSPDENKLAYITFNGGRCYEVDLRSNRRRLMWWSFRTLLADDILGPAVWDPAGGGALFNVTTGMKGDGRDVYVNLATGRAHRKSYYPAFEVVGWLGVRKSADTAR
jgi:Tol biopolymer transport system component